MIRIGEIHLFTNGNAHSVCSALCIIMTIVIEMLFAQRFASQ
jgi:hypothetical protein